MSQIIIPGYYIIFRNDNNGIKKEQFVKLDDLTFDIKGERIYKGYYGLYGYHEIISSENNIRNLNEEERKYSINQEYWKLPQQFYQSY